MLLCHKLSTNIHLIDPITNETLEFDENTYWKYNFKSFVDRRFLEEFEIINVEEDIDYSKYKFKPESQTDVQMSDVSQSKNLNSKSTNFKLNAGAQKKTNKLPSVNVTILSVNKSEDPITIKTHLERLRPGEIYLGKCFIIFQVTTSVI